MRGSLQQTAQNINIWIISFSHTTLFQLRGVSFFNSFYIKSSDANDNWHIFEKEHEKILCERTKQYPKEAVLMFSQTNSASGYPLNYKNFSDFSLLQTQYMKGMWSLNDNDFLTNDV